MKEFYADFEKEKYIVICDKSEMTDEIKKLCLWSPIAKNWISKCRCTIKAEVKTCKATEYNFIKTLVKNGFKKIEKEAEHTKKELKEQKIERLRKSIIKNKEKAKRLRSEYDKYKDDISFLTQPNIVDSARGRTFTRYRNKVLNDYEKSVKLEIYIDEQEAQLERIEKEKNKQKE